MGINDVLTTTKNFLLESLDNNEFIDWTLAQVGSQDDVDKVLYTKEIKIPGSKSKVLSGPNELANFLKPELNKLVIEHTVERGLESSTFKIQENIIEGKIENIGLKRPLPKTYTNLESLVKKLRKYTWVVASPDTISKMPKDPDFDQTKSLVDNTYSLAGAIPRYYEPEYENVKPIPIIIGNIQRFSPMPTYLWANTQMDNDVLVGIPCDAYDLQYTISNLEILRNDCDDGWVVEVPLYGDGTSIDGYKFKS